MTSEEKRPVARNRLVLPTAIVLIFVALCVGLFVGNSMTLFGGEEPTPVPPTPQPTIVSAGAVVEQIQQLSRLETVQYTVRDVVEAGREGGFLGIGSQRMLLIVQGTAVAGVDMSKLTESDVIVSTDGQSITLRLPPVEMFSHSLDQSRTRIYDSQTGLFTRPDENLLVEALQLGENQVLQAACEDGILLKATENAQVSVEQLLQVLEFEHVTVENSAVPGCYADYPIP
jgi:hypothetical protein